MKTKPEKVKWSVTKDPKRRFSVQTFSVRRNGDKLGLIQEKRSGGFFYYGMGVNTSQHPVDSLEQAKKDAIETFEIEVAKILERKENDS